ncbi:MAG: LysR family transcriptional regulator [Flavihumibacter sp.]
MFDFRLQVFYTVAKKLNFTRAAEELFISQPAVTRHIQEIESHFKVQLFERQGSRIKLTTAGKQLQQYAGEVLTRYRQLEFDMGLLTRQHKGAIRIGASTTVAQYVLPPVLAAFHEKFKDIQVTLAIFNTEQVEKALLQKEIDLGVIEGQTKNQQFTYTSFVEDELVLTVNARHPLAKKAAIKPEELLKWPFLLRESGSGTREVLANALRRCGIKINQLIPEMQLGNTESMKTYLRHSQALAFLSVHAIAKELENKELSVVEVKGLKINRTFYFIEPQGQADATADLFRKFTAHYNFRL